MKVAVIGCGFVGEAVADFLETHLIPVYKVDPAKYSLTLDDIVQNRCVYFVFAHIQREDGIVMTGKAVISMLSKQVRAFKKHIPIQWDIIQQCNTIQFYERHMLTRFSKQEVFILGGKRRTHAVLGEFNCSI